MSHLFLDKNGKPLPHNIAVLYGEFAESPIVYRFPQVKGVQWHRDIVPAFRRYLRRNCGLKPKGFFSVSSVIGVGAEDSAEFFQTTKRPRIEYVAESREFVPFTE